MSHKMAVRIYPKRSSLLKAGGRSVNLTSLVVSIHGRPQASIAAIFRQSAGYVFNCSRTKFEAIIGNVFVAYIFV